MPNITKQERDAAIIELGNDIAKRKNKTKKIVASVNLYGFEIRMIEEAIKKGRETAKIMNVPFEGANIDIDSEGGIHISMLGTKSLHL